LIRGNHDHNSNMRNGHFYAVYDMFTVKTVQPNIILCHYAMRSWDRSHYGTWHLHGHHHGKMTPYRNTLDVGVDCNCYKPVSLDEIRHEMEFYWSDPSERRSRGTKK
jgi:calcineurin-like phosphoesterase family protein